MTELDAVIAAHAVVVRRIANSVMRRLPPSIDIQDLIQVGMIGMVDAATRFDPAQGILFETFVASRIRGAMLDELRDTDWLPRSSRTAKRAIEAAMHVVEQRELRAPTEREIADEMKIPLAEYQRLRWDAHGSQLVFTDDLENDDGESWYAWNLPDLREEPCRKLEKKRAIAALSDEVEALSARDRRLLDLVYDQDMNLAAVGLHMDVTESRACQIRTRVWGKLKQALREHGGVLPMTSAD